MSEFRLSEEVTKKKMFLIRYSELEDRLDAQFYWEDMDFTNCVKLSKIAKVSGGKRLPIGFDYSKEITNYRYLRIGNINWDSTLKYKEFKYISKELYTKLKHYEIYNNELLLAIVGATIGKCSLLYIPNDDKIILTENCAKIKIIDPNVLPQYLLFLLQSTFVQKQIQLNYIQTTLPKLGLDRVLSLYLPNIPSIERQEELLNIYQSAFLLKQQKEKQAKELLESIDTYLLEMLGISLPQIDNSLDKRIFEVNLSEVSGGRFDSEFYQGKYKQYYINLASSKYSITSIKDINTFIASGATPRAGGNDYEKNGSIHFLRLTNFNDNLEVNLKKSLFIKSNIHNNMLNRSQLAKGDILFGIAGSIGKIALFNKNIKANINQAIAILRFPSNINKLYIAFILNSIVLKYQINQHQRPVAQPNMNIGELQSLKIPLPPIEKQNEIAEHIQTIRDKAKQFKLEAIQGLESAKAEVEKMILGL